MLINKQSGMKKVGDYILVSELGKGQFGIVYRAKHAQTGDIFAMKTVKKASITSNSKLKSLFDTEVNIMSKIKHPNILHLYEYLETGNNFYLVLDYCNNGDMETHLKKHQFLGEEESVYFLMQVMNGFRELHKHKIMHRDFKLANIFLNDDKLIIGDFGFAKSGQDMATTKLGSPITMAPEMLLSSGGKLVYTNKADLWSIGVCFFQMIFGRLPWDVTDIDDLKEKVQTQSGKNLKFPTQICQISDECKDLLIKLLEISPKQRIEWDDFFNHKLFAIHEIRKKQKENALNMRQSVMFRNNEDIVTKMFEANKKVEKREVELNMEPENIVIEQNSTGQSRQSVHTSAEAKTRIRNRIIDRYTHEKKKIVFFMYTCRKLRNLAKERSTFKKAANGLMYVSILLMKKGIIMNQRSIDSLTKKTNMFQLDGFVEFSSSDDKERLLTDLRDKDQVLYTKLMSHLKDKIKEEVGAQDQRSIDIFKLIDGTAVSEKDVDDQLRKDIYYLVQYFSKTLDSLPLNLKYDMMMALGHLYTSAYSEEYLAYETPEIPFDWNEFDKSWGGDAGIEKINKLLNKALSEKVIA